MPFSRLLGFARWQFLPRPGKKFFHGQCNIYYEENLFKSDFPGFLDAKPIYAGSSQEPSDAPFGVLEFAYRLEASHELAANASIRYMQRQSSLPHLCIVQSCALLCERL
jgi:hypothetical protein